MTTDFYTNTDENTDERQSLKQAGPRAEPPPTPPPAPPADMRTAREAREARGEDPPPGYPDDAHETFPQGRRAQRSNARAITRWLGALLAVLGGVAIAPFGDWASQSLGPTLPDYGYLVVSLAPVVLVAAISAWLLRTWWSLLIVPAAYLLGYEVGAVAEAAARGSLYTPEYTLQYLLLGLSIFAVLYLPLLEVGVAIGTAVATRTAARRGH